MMGNKKLSEFKAELTALLSKLPGKSPRSWFAKEIEAAKGDPNRDVETLEMLCAALERGSKRKTRKGKTRRRATKC